LQGSKLLTTYQVFYNEFSTAQNNAMPAMYFSPATPLSFGLVPNLTSV
jgi:hypothetical protein